MKKKKIFGSILLVLLVLMGLGILIVESTLEDGRSFVMAIGAIVCITFLSLIGDDSNEGK